MANFRHFSAMRKDGTEDLLRIYSTLVNGKKTCILFSTRLRGINALVVTLSS